MRGRHSLRSALLAILVIFLVLVVASRSSENKTTLSVDGYTSEKPPSSGGALADPSTITPTPEASPTPTVYKPDIDTTSWEFVLANNDHNIGTFAPTVVAIPSNTVQFFDERAVDALEQFLQAARDAGYTPYVQSAYRPYSSQSYIFNGKASQLSWDGTYTYEEAIEMAKKLVAYPGTSDHQTGLGLDITDQYYSTLSADTVNQEFMTWLKENCAQYGFILRYPESKIAITGWSEPWHYRYVGKEAAEYIMSNNLCLEQFLDLYKS